MTMHRWQRRVCRQPSMVGAACVHRCSAMRPCDMEILSREQASPRLRARILPHTRPLLLAVALAAIAPTRWCASFALPPFFCSFLASLPLFLSPSPSSCLSLSLPPLLPPSLSLYHCFCVCLYNGRVHVHESPHVYMRMYMSTYAFARARRGTRTHTHGRATRTRTQAESFVVVKDELQEGDGLLLGNSSSNTNSNSCNSSSARPAAPQSGRAKSKAVRVSVAHELSPFLCVRHCVWQCLCRVYAHALSLSCPRTSTHTLIPTR